MSDVKFWDGNSWESATLKTYNGATWDTPAVKVWTGGAWFTIGGATPDVINAATGGYGVVGNGTTDDTGALGDAADAAKAAGKSLYIPTGTYKVINWVPPTDLTIIGDGGLSEASHIKGKVRWNDGDTFRDLFIGDKTTSAIGPYYPSNGDDITLEGVTFTRCKFRGGGTNNPTLNHPALGTSQDITCRDHTFEDCEWECSYNYAESATAQDVSWFVDRGSGDISENIIFEDCHFGTQNDDGNTGGVYGGVVIWSSHNESYVTYPDMAAGYYDNFYFTRCIFEQSDVWNLDLSGAQDAPSTFTENTVYVTDCVFKGLSGAYRPTLNNGTRIVAQEEPGHDCIWRGNIFGIANTNGMKFIKGSSRSVFENNTFDYRTYASLTDQQSGDPQIDEIYAISQVINVGTSASNITIRDNTLLLPTGKYTTLSQQGWIYDPSSRATKTGNAVEWAAGDGPLANY
jgi:hypothetical protein